MYTVTFTYDDGFEITCSSIISAKALSPSLEKPHSTSIVLSNGIPFVTDILLLGDKESYTINHNNLRVIRVEQTQT
jgi:hypothetical protein